jgi:deazaflavin-dependent oxidoreductase (nitroreductase family)
MADEEASVGPAPYLEPPFVVRRVLNPIAMRLGLATTLTVPGRRSGVPRSVPVNVLELDGRRYLVAPRGETQWVRNLRAAGAGELRRRGRRQRFRALELPDEEKRPLIDAYLARWGKQVRSQFEALPDPSQHPVFRIEPDADA